MLESSESYGKCYTTKPRREQVVRQILGHSHFLFFDAALIKHLDQIQEADAAVHRDKDDLLAVEKLFNVLKNIKSLLLDTIRIFMCFEMAFKAELLLKGYVVHLFDTKFCKKNKLHFHEEQKNQPVRIVDMKTAEGLAEEETPKDGYFHSLKDSTIGYRHIKQADYQAKLCHLPDLDTLFQILDKVQKIRNKVHFCPSQASLFWGIDEKSPFPTLDHYAFLREYVTTHFGKRYNALLIEQSKQNGESETETESKLRKWGFLR